MPAKEIPHWVKQKGSSLSDGPFLITTSRKEEVLGLGYIDDSGDASAMAMGRARDRDRDRTGYIPTGPLAEGEEDNTGV